MMISRALYGLKSSGAEGRGKLAEILMSFGLKSRLIHASASASDDLYPNDIKISASLPLPAAPELLSPYKALDIIMNIPFLFPKYVPAAFQGLSLYLALRYSLPISHINIYKSFTYLSRNAIITLSLDITLEYVIDDGGDVVWPSTTNLEFLVNFSSILISNIMCTLTY